MLLVANNLSPQKVWSATRLEIDRLRPKWLRTGSSLNQALLCYSLTITKRSIASSSKPTSHLLSPLILSFLQPTVSLPLAHG